MSQLSKHHRAQTKPYLSVCLVGASHSRYLQDFGTKMLKREGKYRNIEFVHVSVPYPEFFNVSTIVTDMCTYAVLGFGQWTHSFLEHQTPYTNTRSERELRRIIAETDSNTSTMLFLRSMNYNGFGALYTVCPPQDYRLPHVVDMYNAMQCNLCVELGVGYIDLNHIIGPLWDSAADWSHPDGRIFTAEAEHILNSIFTHAVQSKRPVRPVKTLPSRMVLQFDGNETTYLYRNGTLHAFSDNETFSAMGFQGKDVKIIPRRDEIAFAWGTPLSTHSTTD